MSARRGYLKNDILFHVVLAPDDESDVAGGAAPAAFPSIEEPKVTLELRGDRPEPLVFRQGAHPPFGIRWYGVTSLFGHLRNFVARAIATESVDSRDWMRPNSPDELLDDIASVLGVSSSNDTESPPTLVERMGRPLWIDFVADTGDDRDVSAAVGAMLASPYIVEGRELPRGDILLFGGDVAYPVATADEIWKRLVLPWNQHLAHPRPGETKRVVLGVPGNHDWYDGLDGFGRLFRRQVDEPFRADDRDGTSRLGRRLRERPGRRVGLVARQLHLDEVGGLFGSLVAFGRAAKAFYRGVAIRRRRRLVLRSYVPLQEASYFAFALAPGVELWGADRQLGQVDFRQRAFFLKRRRQRPDSAVLFISADPAFAYGVRNEPGARMLAACRLSFDRDSVLFLSGDFHHYERRTVGRSTHVIAGGGGAFLHGTRIAPYPADTGPPDAVYPSGPACRRLALQVPLKLAAGRAGLLVHLALAVLASLELGAAREGSTALVTFSLALSIALGLALYFVAHQGHDKRLTALLAAPSGAALGLLPMGLRFLVPRLPMHAGDGAIIIATAFVGAFVFGVYLTLLAILGIEHQQAFTVLGHPGFKHFVRLCVHPDGKVQGWAIGKDDMLADGAPVILDTFTWEPQRSISSRRPPTRSRPAPRA